MIKNKKMLKLCACIFSTSLILSSTLVITNNNVFSRKKNNIVNNIIDSVDAKLIGADSGKFAFEVIDPSQNTVRLVNGAANGEAIQAINWTIPSTFVYQGTTYTIEEIGTTQVGPYVPIWQRWCFNGNDNGGFNISGKLTLPATIKSIGYCAFQWNNNISEIDLSQCSELETIVASAFYQGTVSDRVDVDKLVIPANVKKIMSNAFDGVKFNTEIHFQGTEVLPSFESNSFTPSSIKAKVYVPKGMIEKYKSIVNFPFTTVYEEDTPTPPTPVVTDTINITLVDGTILKIDSKYIENLTNDYNHVFIIGDKTIKHSDIKSVSFSDIDDLIAIPSYFLVNCPNLESIDLTGANNLQALGNNFLSNCPKLKELNLPNSIIKIGNNFLWKNETLEEINIPLSGLSSIGNKFLALCNNLKSVDISAINSKVLNYRFDDFGECPKLEHIYVNEKLVKDYLQTKGWKDHFAAGVICVKPEPTEFKFDAKYIGGTKGTFTIKLGENKDYTNCSVISTSTDFTANNLDFKGGSFVADGITYKITNVASGAFSNKSNLTGSLTIPNTILSIGDSAFSDCNGLNSNLKLGNSITTIGKAAFKNTNLTNTVVIGNSITLIGEECFFNTKIEIYDLCEHTASLLPYANGMFDITKGQVSKNLKIYVPNDMLDKYKSAEGWKSIADKILTKDPGYDLRDKIQDGVILHCFDWKYTDIKDELENIAKSGFSTIQTSVAQAKTNPNHKNNTWYWLYQPDGFYFNNENPIGTKEQLKDLVQAASKYGIKVVVDVVANHVDSDTRYVQQELGDKWNNNYHHDVQHQIDWCNRHDVTHGEIGMPDLNTESNYVQGIIHKYIQELKDIGVAGVRWDAAKHIGLPSEGDSFWQNVPCQDMYNYGEILKAPDDRESGNEGLMQEYTRYMSVTDSQYSMDVRNAMNNRQVYGSFGNWVARGVNNNKLVYWGESHDNFSNNDDWGSSRHMSQDVIDRAYALAAAHNDITALYFSRPGSIDKENIKSGAKGSTHFKEKAVAEVNKFHNAMCGKADYYSPNSDSISVTRKEGGALIVRPNGGGYVNAKNGGSYAKPGKYIDRISGNEFTITADSITGNVGDSGIAVLYDKPTIQETINDSSSYIASSYSLPIKTLSKIEYYIVNKH